MVGTAKAMPPSQFGHHYNSNVDLYAEGVIAAELLIGLPLMSPQSAKDPRMFQDKLRIMIENSMISELGKNFMKKALYEETNASELLTQGWFNDMSEFCHLKDPEYDQVNRKRFL